MEKKDQEIFKSLEGMTRAKAPENMYNRILEAINRPEAPVVSIGQWRTIAASFLILACLNAFAISRSNNPENVQSSQQENYLFPEQNYNLYD